MATTTERTVTRWFIVDQKTGRQIWWAGGTTYTHPNTTFRVGKPRSADSNGYTRVVVYDEGRKDEAVATVARRMNRPVEAVPFQSPAPIAVL